MGKKWKERGPFSGKQLYSLEQQAGAGSIGAGSEQQGGRSSPAEQLPT